MSLRPIIKLGDSVLTRVAAPVDPATRGSDDFKRLIQDMVETMQAANGIGIAAPQVGVSLQVAIINAKDGAFPIINPAVTKTSKRTETSEEGCLSIPGVFGLVTRPSKISVTYETIAGERVTQEASGLMARVFQHEIDHLNGILFIQRAKRITEGAVPT